MRNAPKSSTALFRILMHSHVSVCWKSVQSFFPVCSFGAVFYYSALSRFIRLYKAAIFVRLYRFVFYICLWSLVSASPTMCLCCSCMYCYFSRYINFAPFQLMLKCEWNALVVVVRSPIRFTSSSPLHTLASAHKRPFILSIYINYQSTIAHTHCDSKWTWIYSFRFIFC